MNTSSTLRCVFAMTSRPARTCLRRQFHYSIRLHQRPDEPPQQSAGQTGTNGKSTNNGSNRNSDGDSRSTISQDGHRPKFCPNCGQRGHGRSECNNAAASEEEKRQVKKSFFGESFRTWKAWPQKPSRKQSLLAPPEQTNITPQQEFVLKGLKPYSEQDKAKLKETYTPAQFAALEAGEGAVDPNDIAQQAALREDPFAFEYYDDFSKIHPVIDKAVKAPEENYDSKLRYKNEDEIAEDFAKFIQDMPDKPSRLDYIKFMDNLRLTVGKEEAERNPRSSLAPEIPKGLDSLQQPGVKPGDADVDPAMKRLMRQTGFSLDEIRRFRVKNLVVHRVVNQTRMGKIQSMYYLTIAGNGRGLLGIGEGKSKEPEDARRQAHFNAIRNVRPIPRYEDRTIFGDVRVKIGAVELELMTRPPGTPPEASYTGKS